MYETIGGMRTGPSERPAGDGPWPLVIDRFDGEFGWLSNFGPGECELDGVTYRSREHAFQAGKSPDLTYRARVRSAQTPGAAKGLGRRVVLRSDWDATARFTVMEQVLESAFSRPGLRRQLVGTGDALLIEGTGFNPRHCDNLWGCCRCPKHVRIPGGNHLGLMLMAVRARMAGDRSDRWARVAVTGHRSLTAQQTAWVAAELPRVLRKLNADHGTTTLISGMAVGADQLAAQAAVEAGVGLWSYLPYLQQADHWSPSVQQSWLRLRAAAAREVVLADAFDVTHLHSRNRLMIRDSTAVIAVHDPARAAGGTHQALKVADATGRPVIRMNIAANTVTITRTTRGG